MKVLWLHSGLLPRACKALGYDVDVRCGWLESLLGALLDNDNTLEFCTLGYDSRQCDITIGRVRYLSYGVEAAPEYKKIPKHLSDITRQVVRDFKPDVIHIHGTEYFYSRFCEDVYGGVPTVISLQGIISACHTHYNGGLSPDEFKWTNLNLRYILKGYSVFSMQRKWRDVRAVQEQVALRQHRYFVGRTLWDRECVRYYNPKAEYYVVNENLRDGFYFGRREEKGIRKHSIFCNASAAYPLKGAHWLLRAIAGLKDEFPDISIRIANAERLNKPKSLKNFALDLPYAAYLRRLINKLGVRGNVELLPALSEAEVVKELETAELFVLPSLCENSPNSLCEAMIIGVPSIATCCGGVQSILKDGIEGRLVPPADPFLLAGAIRDCFVNHDLAQLRAVEARKTAQQRHDKKRNALDMIAVYRDVVKKGH